MPTPTSSSPFAQYARAHGFPEVSKLPGSIGKFLSARPNKIAPNSPMLEELAKFMKRPLSELQAFAKAPPMADRWIKKFRVQIERGTVPRGSQSANKRYRHKPAKRPTGNVRGHYKTSIAKNPLGQLVQEHGLTFVQLAEQIGVKVPVLWKASMGTLASNHPLLPKIAEALNEPLGKLAAMQHGGRLKPGMLKKVARQLGIALSDTEKHDRKASKRVVLYDGKPVATGEEATNGKHHESRESDEKRGYNRLGSKRADLLLRQSTRALISTLNVAVMRGDTHMPPLPVADLYVILRDYVQEKGIKAEVLIDPQFGKLFDPK